MKNTKSLHTTLIFFTLTFERKGSSSDSTLLARPPRPLPRLAGAFRGEGFGLGLGGGGVGLALPLGALLSIKSSQITGEKKPERNKKRKKGKLFLNLERGFHSYITFAFSIGPKTHHCSTLRMSPTTRCLVSAYWQPRIRSHLRSYRYYPLGKNQRKM